MSKFFAVISRMKHIQRWSLMRNTQPENVLEHTAQVALVGHALAVLRNERFGGDVDPGRVASLALFHDATEVITGDMATPIKYQNERIKTAYAELEGAARQRLVGSLPEDLRGVFEAELAPDPDDIHHRLVKAADKICAYLKCAEELRLGNAEFANAAEKTREAVARLDLPEVEAFMATFAPAFALTIDELND